MPHDPETYVDLHDDGLLWLINRVVFHPRGFALAMSSESGQFFLDGNGTEPWRFLTKGEDLMHGIDEDALFAQTERVFAAARAR